MEEEDREKSMENISRERGRGYWGSNLRKGMSIDERKV